MDKIKIIDYAAMDPSVRELLPRYLTRRAADIDTISGLLNEENFDEIRILAHNMHGSGTAYGVKRISEIGREMERAASQADKESVTDGIDALRKLLDDLSTG